MADPGRMEGQCFECAKCPRAVAERRMCASPREDFTSRDSPIYPMYITKGGDLYGFCPGKATWDPRLRSIFQALTITAETGQLPEPGGISAQPAWYIDLAAWFLPRYSAARQARQIEAYMGLGAAAAMGGGTGQDTAQDGGEAHGRTTI